MGERKKTIRRVLNSRVDARASLFGSFFRLTFSIFLLFFSRLLFAGLLLLLLLLLLWLLWLCGGCPMTPMLIFCAPRSVVILFLAGCSLKRRAADRSRSPFSVASKLSFQPQRGQICPFYPLMAAAARVYQPVPWQLLLPCNPPYFFFFFACRFSLV